MKRKLNGCRDRHRPEANGARKADDDYDYDNDNEEEKQTGANQTLQVTADRRP